MAVRSYSWPCASTRASRRLALALRSSISSIDCLSAAQSALLRSRTTLVISPFTRTQAAVASGVGVGEPVATVDPSPSQPADAASVAILVFLVGGTVAFDDGALDLSRLLPAPTVAAARGRRGAGDGGNGPEREAGNGQGNAATAAAVASVAVFSISHSAGVHWAAGAAPGVQGAAETCAAVHGPATADAADSDEPRVCVATGKSDPPEVDTTGATTADADADRRAAPALPPRRSAPSRFHTVWDPSWTSPAGCGAGVP